MKEKRPHSDQGHSEKRTTDMQTFIDVHTLSLFLSVGLNGVNIRVPAVIGKTILLSSVDEQDRWCERKNKRTNNG
jgi:hypothetical protein